MRKTMLAMLSMGSLMVLAGTSAADQGWGQGDAQATGAMQHRFKGRGHGGFMRADPALLKARLGLSEAQVQQLKAIADALRARTKAQRTQLQPLRAKMRELMQAEVIDAGAIYAMRSQIDAIRQVLRDERFKAKLQLMQLLSKQQRDKMKLLRKHRRHHKGTGFGRGGGGFGGGFGGGPEA